MPIERQEEPEDDGPGITLTRWVERSDGELEQVAMPLTPELFLHSQFGDHMSQGLRHSNTARRIADRLEHHFRAERDVLITFDLTHYLGADLPYLSRRQRGPPLRRFHGRAAADPRRGGGAPQGRGRESGTR